MCVSMTGISAILSPCPGVCLNAPVQVHVNLVCIVYVQTLPTQSVYLVVHCIYICGCSGSNRHLIHGYFLLSQFCPALDCMHSYINTDCVQTTAGLLNMESFLNVNVSPEHYCSIMPSRRSNGLLVLQSVAKWLPFHVCLSLYIMQTNVFTLCRTSVHKWCQHWEPAPHLSKGINTVSSYGNEVRRTRVYIWIRRSEWGREVGEKGEGAGLEWGEGRRRECGLRKEGKREGMSMWGMGKRKSGRIEIRRMNVFSSQSPAGDDI